MTTPTVEQLEAWVRDYFGIGDPDVCYAYNLTRSKTAFAYGTVSIDDFVEFDREISFELAEFLHKRLGNIA